MSGLDEQHLEKCPNCAKKPAYWTLGNNENGGLIWIFTEQYHAFRVRNSIRFSSYNSISEVDDAKSRADYVWCPECTHNIKDVVVIKSMLNRAKELEGKGRIDIH